MMFADLTHTPEALAVPGTDLHHPAFYENANDVYPDRGLNAYEINHVISTHFNDVRLKNFIEFRHWDSLPVARAERLTEIIGSLFYDPTNLERLESCFDGIREEDVFEAKANCRRAEARPSHTAIRWNSGRSSSALRVCSPTNRATRSIRTSSRRDRPRVRPMVRCSIWLPRGKAGS